MAGYSQRTLAEKLGLKPGMRVHFRRPPEGYAEALGPLPAGSTRAAALRGRFDFIHAFFEDEATLLREFAALRDALEPDGMLWVSWRKGGAKATRRRASRRLTFATPLWATAWSTSKWPQSTNAGRG